jgi:hypothetical protein
MKSLAIFLPLIASASFANGGEHDSPKPPSPDLDSHPVTVVNTSSLSSTIENASQSAANSSAESASAASSVANADGGDSSSNSGANSTSGGNTVSNSSVYKQKRQAPGVFATGVDPTAGCQGSWHLGASAVGGGVGFGKSHTIRDCVLAAAASEEFARGNLQASILLRCQISYYKASLGDDCIALLDTQTVRKEYVTKEELDRLIKKGLVK